MTQTGRIAIIGGGLAGLATAHALATFGMTFDIYETAPALGEIGAGVNTSPQANKALIAIGLGEKLAAVAHSSAGTQTCNMQTGENLEFADRAKTAARFNAPYYTFHRADLMDALASGLDPATVHLGHRLTAIEDRGNDVLLTFANGKTVEADIVIAADGVRSVIRAALYGDDNPTWTGQMVWRALLKGNEVLADLLKPTGHIEWVGPGCHLNAYYLRGGDVINIVTQEDTDQWVAEGWSTAGNPDEMRASFPNPEPRLEKLLSMVTECSKWGLFTRPLNENWGRGRIQLIGDAAHAMLPNAGQGACQAFEDSYIIARWLASESDPVKAFENFRRVRIKRVHAVQRLSIARSKFKNMRDPAAQKALITADKKGTQGGAGGSDWIWGFDPVTDWDKEPPTPHIEMPPGT